MSGAIAITAGESCGSTCPYPLHSNRQAASCERGVSHVDGNRYQSRRVLVEVFAMAKEITITAGESCSLTCLHLVNYLSQPAWSELHVSYAWLNRYYRRHVLVEVLVMPVEMPTIAGQSQDRCQLSV